MYNNLETSVAFFQRTGRGKGNPIFAISEDIPLPKSFFCVIVILRFGQVYFFCLFFVIVVLSQRACFFIFLVEPDAFSEIIQIVRLFAPRAYNHLLLSPLGLKPRELISSRFA